MSNKKISLKKIKSQLFSKIQLGKIELDESYSDITQLARLKLSKVKLVTIIAIILIILISLITITYAIYRNEIKVTYTSKTGEMVCNIEIEKNDTYNVNGIPYFLVKVRNYEIGSDGKQKLTAVNINYNLIIKNKENSNGMFIWQKEDKSAGINTYLEQITTNTYSFGVDAKEDVYKIFVKTSNNTSAEDVNIEVELNAVQTES